MTSFGKTGNFKFYIHVEVLYSFVHISFCKGEYSHVEKCVKVLKRVELKCAACKALNRFQYLRHIVVSWNRWSDTSPSW